MNGENGFSKYLKQKWPRPVDATREFYNQINAGSDLNVLFSGSQKCEAGHEYQGIRNHFIIHYIHEGKGILRLDHAEYPLSKGMAFALFPDQPNFYQASRLQPWTYSWVGFLGHKARSILYEAGLCESSPVFKAAYSKEIAFYLDSLENCLDSKEKGFHTKAEGFLYLLLAKLAELSPDLNKNKIADTRDEYVEKAVQFIKVNYQREITVEKISKFIGYNRSYFTTLFKKRTGINLKSYLMNFRMEKAKELLKNTGLSINQVAFSSGYPDYFVFARQFKKMIGKSPSAYRQRQGS
jgi:AraC-like DNA-binding protein